MSLPFFSFQEPTLRTLFFLSTNSLQTLKQIHSNFIKAGLHHSPFSLTKLLEFCAFSSNLLPNALPIFDSIQDPNPFIWNTTIRGLSLSSSTILAVYFFTCMLLSGSHPISCTFPFLLKACASAAPTATVQGQHIHAHVLQLGLESDAFVRISLINMYVRNGELDDAHKVFDKSSMRDVVSFMALVARYFMSGNLDDVRRLFDEMLVRDTVSWNAMISGCAGSKTFDEALDLFQEMLGAEVELNENTMELADGRM